MTSTRRKYKRNSHLVMSAVLGLGALTVVTSGVATAGVTAVLTNTANAVGTVQGESMTSVQGYGARVRSDIRADAG
ncbi:MAG: hypothetical protein WCI74_14035 [Actinomycetes bacterium]